MGIWVHVEFLRVQSFLFAVPRLKVMLGANAALGETIRLRLPVCAAEVAAGDAATRPELTLPNAIENDPLSIVVSQVGRKQSVDTTLEPDNPQYLWRQYAVISRDGGHFEAWFANREQADKFSLKARQLISTALPGLRFKIEYDPESVLAQGATDTDTDTDTAAFATLPVFQVCEHSGVYPAHHKKADEDDVTEGGDYASDLVKILEDKGKAFAAHETHDIIGLLSGDLPLASLQAPLDLNELCGNGYLAVIHADGNGVGNLRLEYLKGLPTPPEEKSVAEKEASERFFHGLRVANRIAVKAALAKTFNDAATIGFKSRPYQLLMLGGDDLLMICQARFALPFLRSYAEHLRDNQPKTLPKDQVLSFAAGVTIARASVPFYQLQHLTEALASSAKVQARSLDCKVSTVDWMVHSFSWADDPMAGRLQGQQSNTAKPYRILKEETATQIEQADDQATTDQETVQKAGQPPASLEEILDLAAALQNSEVKETLARSQLRYLRSVFPQGRRLSELALLELPKALKDRLKAYAKAAEADGCGFGSLADVIEVYEIERLGVTIRAKDKEQADE